MASIFAPVLYLGVVVGGLFIFSYYYRKRAANRKLEPYFPSHPERDTYVTLLQQSDPPASDGLIKSALICRAMTDVRRAIKIREDKPALQQLLQKGAIGDDLWNSFLQAEKEFSAEVLEVMHEANSFANGWGQFIFNTAEHMVMNQDTKKLFDEIPKAREHVLERYGKKKDAKSITPSASNEKSTSKSPEQPTKKVISPLDSIATSPTRVDSPPPPPLLEPETQPPSRTKSPVKLNGSLAPPSSTTDADSVASMSDSELTSSSKTPSKKPKAGKKGKKRK